MRDPSLQILLFFGLNEKREKTADSRHSLESEDISSFHPPGSKERSDELVFKFKEEEVQLICKLIFHVNFELNLRMEGGKECERGIAANSFSDLGKS